MTLRQMMSAVRAEASGARALDSVRAIARFHRIQASPGYDRAAEWLCGALEAIGLAPEIERVPGDGRTRFLGQLMPEGWECSRAVATLVAGEVREPLCDAEAEALSVIQRSAPLTGRFPLVATRASGGRGDDYAGLDVRGALVLVRGPAHAAHRRAVLERGAAGLLFDGRRLFPPVRDAEDDPDQIAYTSFWWAGDEPRGAGFVVSPRVGRRLRERLASGERLWIDAEIRSRRFATTIPLVSARIAGRGDGEVLVLSHLCHPKPSANDNASGAAANLETARVLATLARGGALSLERSIRFLWMPELTGTLAWLGGDPARAKRLVAALNLDMVGEDQEACGSTFLMERPPCFAASFAETLLAAVRGLAPDWITSFSGPGHFSHARMAEVPYSGGSDHAALLDPAIGVPCPMLIQWPDRYYHSSHDTPDRCDPRSLELAVRCAAGYAGFLAAAREPGLEWLLAGVEREARVRLLGAGEEPDPMRAVARERVRGRAALASLTRLGVPAETLDRAREKLERFIEHELAPSRPAPAPDGAPAARAPLRLQGGMLDFLRHLTSGYERLDAAEREALAELERRTPESTTLFDLAWFACDGRRTLGEITELVRLETGHDATEALAAFFGWMERLGIARTQSAEDAWSASGTVRDPG